VVQRTYSSARKRSVCLFVQAEVNSLLKTLYNIEETFKFRVCKKMRKGRLEKIQQVEQLSHSIFQAGTVRR
jgi:hypothetical protein